MLDEYWHGVSNRISPEAPVPIVDINRIELRLGGAANVALNCRTLGADVVLLGTVGNDQPGVSVAKLLTQSGITRKIFVNEKIQTTRKLRLVSNFQQVARMDFESCRFSHSENTTKDIERLIVNSDVVIISDYNKGFVSEPQKIIKLAKKHNKNILIDSKVKNYKTYSGSTLLTPNLREFESIVGRCVSEEDIIIKGSSLVETLDLDCLLITRGGDGMTLIHNSNGYTIPAISKEVFDVSGAGDTVIASFALCISAGYSYRKAAEISNKLASIVVSKFGTSTVTLDEVKI